ncbi:energy transducer TonB [Lentiprolixibacter aurantiacus]|uniref:Energy transducer TonB n=1 Tax=Lentiprolixibacter aurantiacus TaxID=2993939 RepID=A0AAE3SLY5_9FLAO|nr:energy transducer TonB [Lentiprolixibacter aurantiacus]MCX2718182.1 energy transducer TonB [Lentiprolixibacter aurantiacus]
MQVKKNPEADLNRNSGLYFVIGLTIVLFLTWRALEYKSYEKDEFTIEIAEAVDDLKEDVPVTQNIKTPPPPPPPAAPEVIEVVEDTEEIEETIIESTETSQDAVVEEAIDVDDVEVGEEEEEISVPFAVIENVPIFPGCESAKNNDERKLCFQEKIQEHVRKEFTYPQSALELGIKGRVFVQFEINSKGLISGIRTRGPDKLLEKEAARIIASLPKMKPGTQRGQAVKVPYSIPINFMIQ